MSFIKVEHITKQYQDHKALDNVSFKIEENTIFGLLGPNGAGKSTFLRILTQIIAADKGAILIGQDLLKDDHKKLIGYLPEERGLYKKMKVREHLQYLADLRGVPKATSKATIDEWLDRMDLVKWQNNAIGDLSKGMQQKTQFIATIVHDPQIIILDEPFSGFDPVNVDLVKREIHDLKEQGKTIIFSTHRMEQVEEMCDDIVLIHQSKNILEGPVQQIKENFDQNVYTVTGKRVLVMDDSRFEIVRMDQRFDDFECDIKVSSGYTGNDLLETLVLDNEIMGYHQNLPSIHQIFISMVKGEIYEQDINHR